MGKLWFLEQGFQTLQILAADHWHSEEMHHDLGSKPSNSVCCPSFVFQFSDLLAHIHILKCSNDSLANTSAKSGSKTRQGLDWCLHNSFRFSWEVSVAGFAYSCVCNAWQEAMLSVLRHLFFGTFHRTGLYYCSNGRSKSVGGRIERWATSKQEWVCNLFNLLHFLLDWTFACPETWIRHFTHKVLIWKETPTNSRSDVKTTAWSGTFRSTTRRVSQLLLEKSSSSDIARTILF